jgi:hypothetical protein
MEDAYLGNRINEILESRIAMGGAGPKKMTENNFIKTFARTIFGSKRAPRKTATRKTATRKTATRKKTTGSKTQKRPLSAYNKFVKTYLNTHKGKHLEDAAAVWSGRKRPTRATRTKRKPTKRTLGMRYADKKCTKRLPKGEHYGYWKDPDRCVQYATHKKRVLRKTGRTIKGYGEGCCDYGMGYESDY